MGWKNLGPKSAAWLRAIGITRRDDLGRMGVIEACRRMRQAGHPVSLLAAYALEGASLDVLDYRRMERATPVTRQ